MLDRDRVVAKNENAISRVSLLCEQVEILAIQFDCPFVSKRGIRNDYALSRIRSIVI